jgi:uncharacterized protein
MSKRIDNIHVEISAPYRFSLEGVNEIEKNNRWARNQWPLVYILDNCQTDSSKKMCYVGESTNLISRIKSHLQNEYKKERLNQISLISCDKFNKSATLDIESSLIRYLSAEGSYELMNGNYGLASHNYYERDLYRDLFRDIWTELIKQKVVRRSLIEVENSEIFKYSPYKSLNEDQYNSLMEILETLTSQDSSCVFIEGNAGTGKTILATFLIKLLKSNVGFESDTEIDTGNGTIREIEYIRRFQKKYPNAKIGLVVAMTSLNGTLKKVFKQTPGLDQSMVINPSQTFNGPYDLLIVDEAHRLRQYKNLGWMGTFRKNNQKLELDDNGTELDWIMANSKSQIFFYDRDQTVRPSDIDEEQFRSVLNNPHTVKHKLASQLRCLGGANYITFVDGLFDTPKIRNAKFDVEKYELIIFDSIKDMKQEILLREEQYGISRMVSGYSWPWRSKQNPALMDIEIEGEQFQWNKVTSDWIYSPTAKNEIGCIHTTMGYDLNYTGVIFGREISYNPANNRIEINRSNYYDKNGKTGASDEQLKIFILNIYKNIMKRGIRGTFVYAYDPALREYLKQHIPVYKRTPHLGPLLQDEVKPFENAVRFLDISAAAGTFSQQQHVSELRWINLPSETIITDNYFVCKVVGESMNKIIPNGSLCLFKQDNGGSRQGEIALIESTHIQDADFGSGYTVKEYHSTKQIHEDNWEHQTITLKPLSTDPNYAAIELTGEELTSFRVVGIFVKVLKDVDK